MLGICKFFRLARAEIHVNLDLLPEPVKDCHKAVHGEAVQLDAPDAGKVRRRNAGDLPGNSLREGRKRLGRGAKGDFTAK